jgi:hypothetical protein|tara:strand:+ start:56 stop:259 length:204 start_codon:yes stop_codon:yes gene_type:complete
MEPDREQLFWLDEFKDGNAKGGFYVRNDLVKTIKRLEAQGQEVVGLKYDGTFNLELIIKVPSEQEKN